MFLQSLSKVLLFLFLVSCESEAPPAANGEYIYRKHDEFHFTPLAAAPQVRPLYPWETALDGNFPKITKEFFRCKGSSLNPPRLEQRNGESVRYADCGGAQKHSLPLRDNKEFVYPVLIDLLNHIQAATQKRVVITSGHRCPDHNNYVNPSPSNQYSKHMVGAEVSFYVQGFEDKPETIVKTIQDYYKNKTSDLSDFKRYEKGDTDVSTQPWMNKEIFIKIYKAKEGRDYDNRHPYPYLSIQVRHDLDLNQRVTYSWDQAFHNFMRY